MRFGTPVTLVYDTLEISPEILDRSDLWQVSRINLLGHDRYVFTLKIFLNGFGAVRRCEVRPKNEIIGLIVFANERDQFRL